MRNKRARAWLLSAATLGIAMTAASESLAWKPYTHVYLAQQAWEDAVDDGRVTIYRVDPSGQIALDASRRPIAIGTYAVSPRVLTAIRNAPEKFFAGVLGPDAYPDIITGQMRIHPPGPTSSEPDSNVDGPGTDPWLQQIWARAWVDGSDNAIAWAAGFLAHAAGDIYAHTFMNTFAGGIFDIQDMTGFNWFKHITVEGYVGQRTPDLHTISAHGLSGLSVFDVVRDTGVTGIENFIADNTTDVFMGAPFPNEANKRLSVPYLLEQLRAAAAAVDGSVRAFDSNVWNELSQASYMGSPMGMGRELDWACGGSTCPDPSYSAVSCPGYYPHGDSWASGACFGMGGGGIFAWAAAWQTLAAVYGTAYALEHPFAATIENWTHNAIVTTPTAKHDWVTASHNTAIHLFFTSDHLMHMDGDEFPARETLGDGYTPFKIDMESMLTGLPRSSVQAINDFIDYIMAPYNALKTAIGDAEKWVIDQVFQATLHMSIDQAKQCFVKPHMWLNPLFASSSQGMQVSLQSANAIMRLPTITPATCTGSTDQCTLAPSLVGANVTGACDLLASSTPAKFSVRPGDAQGVFPAAFNTVNMIKLLLMDPADVTTLANTVRSPNGNALTLEPPSSAPSAPPNAMLNFAATIDGSHEWLSRREGIGQRMILARDCTAYRSVFLDQRPDFDTSLHRLSLVDLRTRAEPRLLPDSTLPSAWEPAPETPSCIDPRVMLKAPLTASAMAAKGLSLNGPMTVTASEASTFTVTSASKNANASLLTRGSITVAPDGLTATYVPPKWSPHGGDQIVVTSKDGARRTVVNVAVDSPVKGGFRRELPKAAIPGTSGDPAGLHAGETAQLVGFGKTPMTWTIVSGSGSVGDAKLEATHAAQLVKHQAIVADSEKTLAAQRLNLQKPSCKAGCRTQASASTTAAARARVAAKLDASQTQKKLDDVRSTFRAPDTIARDEIVTLRGVDAAGKTATVSVRLLAPPTALKMKSLPPTIASGKDLKLEIDHGLVTVKDTSPSIPMTWKVVAGPGTVGDPGSPTRERHVAQRQAFLAGLDPLNKQLANARAWEAAAARKAWLDYVLANVPKYAPSFAALDEIDRTYHAPAKLAGKQRVTLRGTAQDGSGRTIDVSFDVVP